MKLWSILGNSQKLDGGAMSTTRRARCGSNGSRPTNSIVFRWPAVPCWRRRSTARRCCSKTGIGAFFEPKLRDAYGDPGRSPHPARFTEAGRLQSRGHRRGGAVASPLRSCRWIVVGMARGRRALAAVPEGDLISSVAVAGSVRRRRIRAIAPVSLLNCRDYSRRAGDWKSSMVCIRAHSAMPCVSTTAKAIRQG